MTQAEKILTAIRAAIQKRRLDLLNAASMAGRLGGYKTSSDLLQKAGFLAELDEVLETIEL